MDFDNNTYRLKNAAQPARIFLFLAVIGLVLTAVGYFVDAEQFFFSYLTAYVYWLTIALGGLFFTMLHHIVNAKWSVVLRRLSENIMSPIPIMAIFFIPILFGMNHLFQWSQTDIVANDHLLQAKSGYLNITFFIIRLVIYFAIWIFLTVKLYKMSLNQDIEHTRDMTRKFRVISGAGIILFALTLTFASFDWLMSLDPHWYSTIFGVYIFSGSLLAMLALLTVIVMIMAGKKILSKEITPEHYHDLGKLMFAFTIFWGYMAFSQYFLIWYGNIPEETIWMLHRWEGTWKTISLILVFGHFVIPFFVLFPQTIKRNRTVMILMGIWLLVMHWIDVYWMVMPVLHHHGYHLSWMDLTAFIGLGGLMFWLFWRKMQRNPLVPIGDPYLEKSIHFENL